MEKRAASSANSALDVKRELAQDLEIIMRMVPLSRFRSFATNCILAIFCQRSELLVLGWRT